MNEWEGVKTFASSYSGAGFMLISLDYVNNELPCNCNQEAWITSCLRATCLAAHLSCKHYSQMKQGCLVNKCAVNLCLKKKKLYWLLIY